MPKATHPYGGLFTEARKQGQIVFGALVQALHIGMQEQCKDLDKRCAEEIAANAKSGKNPLVDPTYAKDCILKAKELLDSLHSPSDG